MGSRRATRGDTLVQLVHAAQSGDEAAFAQIVELTSPKVYALCLRLSGNEHDARDIMQEAYLRVFRSLSSFRAQSSLSTWIYRIAANCAATHLAKRQRRGEHTRSLEGVDLEQFAGEDRVLDPQLFTEATEDRQRLIAALELLPFSLRSVIVLGDVYELSHEEIAHELAISRAAVKVRLHRGRRRLFETLYPARASDRSSADLGELYEIDSKSVLGARSPEAGGGVEGERSA